MASTSEKLVAQSLRPLLDGLTTGSEIPDSKQLQTVCTGLEYFLSEVLREIHGEWINESFDGILPYSCRKTGDLEAEIIGHAILISDQSTTPFHLRFQLAETTDEVTWMELCVGEKSESGMVRRPYSNPPSIKKIMAAVIAAKEGRENVHWVYRVGFGEKRP